MNQSDQPVVIQFRDTLENNFAQSHYHKIMISLPVWKPIVGATVVPQLINIKDHCWKYKVSIRSLILVSASELVGGNQRLSRISSEKSKPEKSSPTTS